jgi:hypothetical protein
MSDAEFELAIAPFRPPSRRKVTPKMRAHGLRMRIRTMLLDLRAARRTLADLSADSRTALTTDLTTLATESTALASHLGS